MARLEELERKFEENPRRYFAPLANEYRKAGDAQRAADLCRSQLPEVPGHISGHIVLGQALYDARDFDGSRAALETALALDPENIVALRYLGDIARDTGDAAEAGRWYSRTLEADPYNEAATTALQALRSAPAPGNGSPPSETPQTMDDVAPDSPEPQPAPDSLAAGFEPTSHAEPEPSQAVEPHPAVEVTPPVDIPVDIADAAPTESAPEIESPASGVLTVTGEFAGDLSVSTAPETEPGNGELSAESETTEPVTDEPVAAEPASDVPAAMEPADERFDVAAHAPPEPETPEEAVLAEERVLESAAPFVTETMADLYLEQGYPHEALELLLQLSEQRPQDEPLRAKIEHIESVIVARRDAAVAAARAERAETAEATAGMERSEDAVEAMESTEPPDAPFDTAVAEVDFSAFAAVEPEPEPEPEEPISVQDLFARMDRARPRAASAVTPRPISRRRSDFVPMPEGEPAASDASDDPFAFPSPPAAPSPVPRTSGPHPTFNPSTADPDDFNAWLRGLRGP